jgi:hypothetical protein
VAEGSAAPCHCVVRPLLHCTCSVTCTIALPLQLLALRVSYLCIVPFAVVLQTPPRPPALVCCPLLMPPCCPPHLGPIFLYVIFKAGAEISPSRQTGGGLTCSSCAGHLVVCIAEKEAGRVGVGGSYIESSNRQAIVKMSQENCRSRMQSGGQMMQVAAGHRREGVLHTAGWAGYRARS